MAQTHRLSRLWIHLALCLILASGWLAARPVPVAQAQTQAYDLYVNYPGDGIAGDYQECKNGFYGVQDCNLRGAILKANSDPAHRYTIRLKPLPPGDFYELTRIPMGDPDDNLTGDLDITTNLAIYGNGATIDANGIDRIIDFNAPLPGVNVSATVIQGLTLTGGHAPDGADGTEGNPDGGSGQNGGAIRIRNGSVELVGVTVAGNQAGAGGKGRDGLDVQGGGTGENGGNGGTGGSGGGIYVQPTGRLRTDHCRVIDNHAAAGGAGGSGGWGTDSYGNPGNGGAGGNGGMGGYGGGIYAEVGSTLLLQHSSFERNTAGAGGTGGPGGLGSPGDSGTPSINGGKGGAGGQGGYGGYGGGVYAFTLDVSHSLYFTENVAGKGGDGGTGGEGGSGIPPYSDGGAGGNGGYAGSSGYGGGLALKVSGQLTNTVFAYNVSGAGGKGGAGGAGGSGQYEGAYGDSQDGSAGGLGGGILADDISELKLNFTTIVYNTTGSHGAGFIPPANQDYGGGISARGPVSIKNSILYFNTVAGSQTPDNCHWYYPEEEQYTGGHNLLQSTGGCEFEPIDPDTPGDVIGLDPLLTTAVTPLEPWRAPMGLLPGSPAIDHIPPADCISWGTKGYPPYPVTVDQWKQNRPSGFGCDIGAFEYQFAMVYLPAVIR